MPRLSDTMEEGTIVRWLKTPGDTVTRGEVVAEVETDKATMDFECYETGILEQVLVPEGATASIGDPVAVIGSSGGSISTQTVLMDQQMAQANTGHAGNSHTDDVHPAESEPLVTQATKQTALPPRSQDESIVGMKRVLSSPLVRALAHRHNIDISQLAGSGPGGRVMRADVESAISISQSPTESNAAQGENDDGAHETDIPSKVERQPAPFLLADGDEKIPLTLVRRVTAARLTESAKIPQFHLTIEVDAGPLLDLRIQINNALPEGTDKVSITDLIVKACANELRDHSEVNSSYSSDFLVLHRDVNIGIAVAIPDGLVVPVIRHADRMTIRDVARASRALAERARQGKLSPEDLNGGTFTISNLGMYGIDRFDAVLNPPQAAILAVGRTMARPAVRDGRITVVDTMHLTLSVDHRVLDGAGASKFLDDLRSTLEKPYRIVT